MTTLETLQDAIANRTPVSFEYTREGKQPGQRYGHPHAVFIRRLKSGEEKVYLHLWQLDGVTDSGKELPDWRQFFVNNVHDVNPDSSRSFRHPRCPRLRGTSEVGQHMVVQ